MAEQTDLDVLRHSTAHVMAQAVCDLWPSAPLDTLEGANSSLITGGLADELTKLKQQPGKNIQIPGSPHAGAVATARRAAR